VNWLKGLRARAEFRLRFDFGVMVGSNPTTISGTIQALRTKRPPL
jgi:hypothetical protein